MLIRLRERKLVELVFDIGRALAGDARILALLAALTEVAVAGSAGAVDLLALFMLGGDRRHGHAGDRKQDRTCSLHRHSQFPKESDSHGPPRRARPAPKAL